MTLEFSDPVYTISRLNNEARQLLESNFAALKVEGEISNFSAPSSGHWYFSLKDQHAQVRCAMFRAQQRQLAIQPKNGLQVIIKARVSLYENRGEFQLIAEDIEELGAGKLRLAFEMLKKKLVAAGLFDTQFKKPLPRFPHSIGVVTSATGAAIRDIITVLQRRYASAAIIIYPAQVQGANAAATIVQAIQTANRRLECEVLILARGGGSLEDLWPFNEEMVANAIFASHLPIISGVGHEIDFTIADFTADVRAATPSAAAELAVPDQAHLLSRLDHDQQQLQLRIQQKLINLQRHIGWIETHLLQQHPKRKLAEKIHKFNFLMATIKQLQKNLFYQIQHRLQSVKSALNKYSPLLKIQHLQHEVDRNREQLIYNMRNRINKYQARLSASSTKLEILNPVATLSRGFAIATNADGTILHDAAQVTLGQSIQIKLNHGFLHCTVQKISDKQN